MSRKNSIIIILVLLLLIVSGLLFFYFSSNKAPVTLTTPETATSPFGGGSPNITTSTSTGTSLGGVDQTTIPVKTTAKLIHLYNNPTSGLVFFSNNNQSVLRFVDRAVGNIYQYIPETETGEAQRVTNTTIPKIQETAWSSHGNSLVFRYLDNNTDNIVSFSAKLVSSSTDALTELTGSFISPNMKELVTNPNGDKIFGLVNKSDKSGTYGFTTNIDGSNKKTIFDSAISFFNISWPKESIITFTTKPSYREAGLLYFFNTQTYSLEKILGNITGMSTVTNKDASLVAYSYSIDNAFALDIYDTVNKVSKDLIIKTIADKCVWGNKNSKVLYCAVPKTISPNNYPDAWYQGEESFGDNIWKIDTESGGVFRLYQIGSNENTEIDAFDLKISLDDQYLSFSDKNDLSLWLLKTGN
jgi:hypothetical protein